MSQVCRNISAKKGRIRVNAAEMDDSGSRKLLNYTNQQAKVNSFLFCEAQIRKIKSKAK